LRSSRISMSKWTALCRLASFFLLADVTPSAAQRATVKVGIVRSITDVGVLIAADRGYFEKENISVEIIPFSSAAQMIAPLASGELSVGGGGPSAALYNAAARGIDIRMVADKTSTPPGYPQAFLLVRKDLVESGKYKGYPDLKGMRIGGTAPGASSTPTLYKLLALGGLTVKDVERVYLSFPQQAVALQNKAIDAGLTAEPSATLAVRNGSAARIVGDDVLYPNHQAAVILYSGQFAKNADVATRFMKAYLRGVRDFNDALKGNQLAGPKGDEVIAVLAQRTNLKDRAVYRDLIFNACDPDGAMNIASLNEDLESFRREGFIKGSIQAEQVVDMSFANAAVKELGPYYKPAR
jgi:NitT/TauT family transport system substrate-binding protein